MFYDPSSNTTIVPNVTYSPEPTNITVLPTLYLNGTGNGTTTFSENVTLVADQYIVGDMCGTCTKDLIYMSLLYIPLNKTIRFSTTECGGCPLIKYLVPSYETARRRLLADVNNYKFIIGCRTSAPCYGKPTFATYSPVPYTSPTPSPSSSPGLSAGSIAGIVVGGVVGVCCCGCFGVWALDKRRKRKDKRKTKTPGGRRDYKEDDLKIYL